MADRISTRIEGLEKVLAILANIDAKLRKKILRQATAQAGKMALAGAKARVAQRTGLLKKSLGRKAKTFRNNGVSVAIVGPRKGFKATLPNGLPVDPVKYAHLVERGSRNARAQPFLRPVLDEQGGAMKQAMINVITNGIQDATGGR